MEIETVLSNWKKLHTLRIPYNMPGIDLSIYPHLKKVVLTTRLKWHPVVDILQKKLKNALGFKNSAQAKFPPSPEFRD